MKEVVGLDELERQINKTEIQTTAFDTSSHTMASKFDHLAYCLKSLDSNMSNKADQYFWNFSTLSKQFVENLQSIIKDMRLYIQKTKENEHQAESDIAQTNENLTDESANL